MKIEVLEDNTVVVEEHSSLDTIAGAGNAPKVNQLDADAILAIFAAAKVRPYENEVTMRGVYRKILDLVQTKPGQVFTGGKPTTTLGELRKALLMKIGGQFNDPHSQYLDIAVHERTRIAA